ncbi:glycosyltransferase [Cryobacterium sp. TMT2-18-3]|uniref:Glycosyltransferase n=1 Tax=Cryobacterium sandaracinum TaxID=1259247 RepID=A0ABY2JHM3_9MICO|nr:MULTISPECIES: WecB/TagA/CpsF family glycosyltransferase [Cryobacterium]TFC32019.1 glycosyltransferase [Cryobacterium sp. TMT2-18-2]TFC62931.1 glycosyltransferase [Cryobacterium sp. TMT2-18-3]TFD06087.1 glycosyltransferase [Cryobacterium sandaracinum]
MDSQSQWVGSIEFEASTPQSACEHIVTISQQGRGAHVHLANAYTVALADRSADYRGVLAAPAINYPDGKPIGWVSELRGHSPRLNQVRGPQLFLDVFDQGRAHGLRHFLLGSTPEVLSALELELARRFPGVKIVGVESPPFRKLSAAELQDQDSRIRETAAQIVWVGLGTPKQDVEAQRIASALPVVAIAIGAAFDFAAGTLRSAPAWMTNVGLEWVYRLICEPRRLWKRYVFGNVRFLKAAFSTPKV